LNLVLNEYNEEQLEAIVAVRDCLEGFSPGLRATLIRRAGNYLTFRQDVDAFLACHFSGVCTLTCYEDRRSACCNREGIITFFADVAINVLISQPKEIDRLIEALNLQNLGTKCVYLGNEGCLWKVKPIVCEMFLCKYARGKVFDNSPAILNEWRKLRRREKRYTWPNRPVLFDELERYFMERGCGSSLMYCHNSPGLLRMKAQWKTKSTGFKAY